VAEARSVPTRSLRDGFKDTLAVWSAAGVI